MKELTVTIVAIIILLASVRRKHDIIPLKPDMKKQVIGCRQCTGSWDITDPGERR